MSPEERAELRRLLAAIIEHRRGYSFGNGLERSRENEQRAREGAVVDAAPALIDALDAAEARLAGVERDREQQVIAKLDALARESAMLDERDEARANYQFMVDRAANEKLDGYRELGARAAAAENERDEVRRAFVDRVQAVTALVRERDVLAGTASDLRSQLQDALASAKAWEAKAASAREECAALCDEAAREGKSAVYCAEAIRRSGGT